ncbi:hypothetical protein QTP70_012727 [Hemibagrus guttatus]|uniref:ribonuclease H n=1 Tax=Hemibagrus guttatus TaxID=175788 RepID=A0AAE0RGR4_9TELE|nr:hypothetical protein QTP70_012727 [Hemibagrus guttatus]
MSSRLSLSLYRLEAEIERCRAECQWDRLPTLVEQLAAARFHEDDDYGLLLQAEALLENCLLENVALLRSSTPLSEHTQPKLAQAKGHLNSLLSRGRLEPRYLNEALLLLAKVHYAQGHYRDAQGMCARAGIDEFTRDEQPLYHLRLLAEAFVIKGLSLDHQTVSAASRVRLSEREEECLSCYLRACDTALHYLQELDKGAGGNWATVGRRSRGGRRVHRQREKRKGKGRELADVMERRKVDILCVQETRWKGSKARSIGAGFKLFYYGVDSKRNGVGVVLKEEFVRNVLEVGCELEEKERFWSELDEVMESIPTSERVVIGADFNGHVGEGNTGDEEVMGKFGVKERNLEGQMVVDFAKRMDMGVVNTYFQKREEHRVTYKSGGRRTQKKRKKLRQALGGQVVLPDDWETTAEVIRETGRKVLGVSSGRRKEDKETWWWNEEVQDSIQRKRLAKKKWDMDRTEENRQEYKELQRRVKREVSKAKQKAYDELYTRLDTREGEKDLYRLARQRDRDGKDVQQVRVIKDRDGRVLTSEESVQRRWKEYFEELMNEENEREKRVEGVNSVEQKVDKIRKDEVRKALKRMKSGKAVGPDDIPVEVWKCLGEAAVEFLASLFNRVLENLEKAYDRVPREELWYCMRKSGVAEKYVRVVQDMYERSRTVVRCAVGQTEEFNVEVGLHQGSALSPFLFAIVMDQLSEEVRQESPWTMMFADDIVICSESREQVEENLERWRFALERRGMKVSRSKTEYMCVNEREGSGTVRLQGEEVKKVQEFKYLGSTVQSNGECGKEAVYTASNKTAKSSISASPVEVDPGYFLQAALQSAYLCLLHKGHLVQGTNQLRQVLRAVESRGSQNFRKASGEAVISRTPEHKEAREASIQDASSVYDLLSIGMARRGQYAMLSECLERAMKFSFSEFHLWYQLGLSLMASGKNEAAVSVLKECTRMKPQDPTPPLLAAKVCINQLHWTFNYGHKDEAEALAKSVTALGEGAEESLARAHLTIGLCYSLQASDAILKGDRDEFNRRALRALQTAHEVDPQDPQIALYLSLQLALVRQLYDYFVAISAAMEPLQLALNLRSDDLHSLHLLVLLLSAQKHYQHALDTLTLTLSQYPDNFNLLFTKMKLEEALFGPAVALQTCEEMLHLWQTHYDFARPSETDDSSSIPPPEPGPLSRKPSGLHLTLPDFQETETGSQSAPSLAVSRLEQVLSEVSAVSSIQRHGPAHIWTTLERIWLQAGELFMVDGRLKEAQFCVQEAGALFPTSHSVLLLRGRLAEHRGNDTEAKSLYDEALAINPTGHHILIHLGKLLVRMGRVGLGEKVLRDAVQTHSLAHEAWSGLGEALQSRGSAQAPDCFLTALELESSCPIRPFTIIPREL